MSTINLSSLPELQLAAERGEARAQYLLGTRYRKGDGVPQDEGAAFRWVKAAAEQGEPDAQNDLGVMYGNGEGVARDDVESARWYRLAADEGRPTALFNLGHCFLDGRGIAMDYGAAAECFDAAAKLGDIRAVYELGTLFRFGRGVKQNILAAAGFHVIAALNGNIPAMGNLYDYHGEIEKHALAGSQAGSLFLAKMYDRGLGVEQDRLVALAWLTWGAKNCAPDEDPKVREEIAEMSALRQIGLDEDAKARVKIEYMMLELRVWRDSTASVSRDAAN